MTLADLQSQPGADVLRSVAGILRDEAERINQIAAACDRAALPFDDTRFATVGALLAGAETLDRVRIIGGEVKAKGLKPSPIVQTVADVVRSCMILELQRREPRNANAA